MNVSSKASKVKESSTLAITARAKALKASGAPVISFSVGEPDFDTPKNIKAAALEAMNAGFTKYTASSGVPELRKAIAEKLKKENGLTYEPSQIVVSNGAKHALSNAFTAIINDGDEIIIPAPFWITYPELVKLLGGVSVFVYADIDNGYKPTPAQIEAAITKKTKAILLNSPNNPTGAVYSEAELRAIADIAVKHDIFVISDEIYEKLIYNETMPHVSIASFNDEIFKRTIVINGFSKSYAMTGWRVGYSASTKELAEIIGNVQSHQSSNVNSIAQKAALAAYTGSQDSIEAMRIEFQKRRDYLYERCGNVPGFKFINPDGAFYVFIDISELCAKNPAMPDAAAFASALLEKHSVAIIPCADFGYPNHIRLTYALSMEEIVQGMDRIESFVKDNF